MTRRSEFVDWLVEELAPLGHVWSRAMFGGFGIYLDELFFALVVDDVAYLKADPESQGRFEDLGCRPFSYVGKGGKRIALSFYQLPDQALDDGAELIEWGRLAVDAVLRTKAAGQKKARKDK